MKLTYIEIKFLDIIWNNEGINSGDLVKKCHDFFGWKKSTTYTLLKRLQERGVLINDCSSVKTLISKQDVQQQESANTINNIFDGSLSCFVTSFLSTQKLSEKELDELKNLIDTFRS